jgi:hypothetical protein
VLKAADDGFYPVMKWGFKEPQGGIWLNAGGVWKYGTSANPWMRYEQSFLDEWGLVYEQQFTGTLLQAKLAEARQIWNYFT